MWMRRTWCTKLRHIFDLGFGCTHTHLSSGVKRVGWNPSLLQFSISHCHKISEKSSGGNNASTRWFCNEDCRTLLPCYLDHLHFTGGTFNLTNHLSFFAHFYAANPEFFQGCEQQKIRVRCILLQVLVVFNDEWRGLLTLNSQIALRQDLQFHGASQALVFFSQTHLASQAASFLKEAKLEFMETNHDKSTA